MSDAKRIHLIGVCGTAMATLAALLKSRGHVVQGSDQNVYPPMSEFLVEQGIKTFSGYSPDHITPDIDLVVVGEFPRDSFTRDVRKIESRLNREINFSAYAKSEFAKERKKEGGFLNLVLKGDIIVLKGIASAE